MTNGASGGANPPRVAITCARRPPVCVSLMLSSGLPGGYCVHGCCARVAVGVALWMNIELRHLRYFVAVAEEASFSAAARRVHVAQQVLSTQIRQLEEAVGTVLLRRTSRGVFLTAAGG